MSNSTPTSPATHSEPPESIYFIELLCAYSVGTATKPEKPISPLESLYQAAKSALGMTNNPEAHTLTESQGFGMLDMVESDNSFTIYIDCPGMKKEDIDLSIKGNKMVILGKRDVTPAEEGFFYYSERSTNEVQREILLPHGVDLNFTTSEYIDGVLTIKLLKVTRKDTSVIKRIPVNCVVLLENKPDNNT